MSNMHPLPIAPSFVTKDEQPLEPIVADVDDRSSSLSEIEDRGVAERLGSAPAANGSEGGDTEAETERLEDSPEKARSQQNVVLTAASDLYNNGETQADGVLTGSNGQANGITVEVKQIPQTSDISSLEDSSDDAHLSHTNNHRKRKRASYTPSPQPSIELPTKTLGYVVSQRETGTREQSHFSSPELDGDGINQGSSEVDEDLSEDATSALMSQKKSKGKRKAKKTEGDAADDPAAFASEVDIVVEPLGTAEVTYSNGEEVVMEDPPEGAEIETEMIVKSEEGLVKKKTALDALSAIEQCFASLKEKLCDERIARCDAELAMLDSSTPTHPDLVAALEVIDRHRDEKIRYEDTLVKYKLEALQRRSIAEKAQAHSQYMLRVQDIRETHLEKLNQHFYQIQHERRSTEATAEDYMYHFQPKRSDQIRRQAAYNKEVSLLSGIAKHVGFPAAPDIKGLKQTEIDDDLRAMGITLQPAPAAPLVQSAIPRPSLPLSASFSMQKSTTDERFLEQNPWANPQHPAHGRLQRQTSALSRPESPLITPAPQKRVIDLTGVQGSASTIVEPRSSRTSSQAPTPATGEERPKVIKSRNNVGSTPATYSTPIKAPDIALDDPDAASSAKKDPKSLETNLKPLAQPPTPVQRNPTPKAPSVHGNSISNPLSVPDGPVPYSTPPMARFSSVKLEDRPTHSILGHHVPGALSISTGPNGSTNRFGGVV